jgi:hypothetical protein
MIWKRLQKPLLILCGVAIGLVALIVTIEFILQTISSYSFTALLGIIGRWFVFTSDGQLSAIGIVLVAIGCSAWNLSNRAEATPNTDQLEEMRHFVSGHFASYVARGLAAEGAVPEKVVISRDPAWRKIYLQHLKLHNELYAFRRVVALKVFDTYVDDAVRAELVTMRDAGMRADPMLVGSQSVDRPACTSACQP